MRNLSLGGNFKALILGMGHHYKIRQIIDLNCISLILTRHVEADKNVVKMNYNGHSDGLRCLMERFLLFHAGTLVASPCSSL